MRDETTETSPVQRYADSFAAQCAQNLTATQAELHEALNYRERLSQ